MADNIITAVFGATRETKVRPRYRYDQGQVLMVRGVKNLPDFYEVHFANEGSTADATPLIGTADGVTIPDTYFQSGATIYAYIYVHDEATDGTTVYKVTIPIINRARPANVEPSPEDADIIAQAIVALNENVGRAEDAAEQAEESAESAQSAADGAAQAERNAGVHADRAEAAAQAAEASAGEAEGYTERAETAAQNAQSAAENAEESAQAAEQSAYNAGVNASSASSAKIAAQSAASNARSAASDAVSAKNDAVAAKTDAQTAATSAASSRDAARIAKVAAETAQSTAEAAQIAAEAAETDTQTYAGQASQSAADAAQSAASAEQTLAQVQAEGAAQIAAIDAEGQRVIDSIPEDYTEVVSDVADLKSQINSVGYVDSITPQLVARINVPINGTAYESGNNYDTYVIPVEKGATYTVSIDTTGNVVRFAFSHNFPANGVSCEYLTEVYADAQHLVFSYRATADGYLTYSHWRATITAIITKSVNGYVHSDLYDFDSTENVNVAYVNIENNGTSYARNKAYRTYYFAVKKGASYQVTILRANATSSVNYYRVAYCSIVPNTSVNATFIKEIGTYDESYVFIIIAPDDGYLGISSYVGNVASISVVGKGVTQRLSNLEHRFPVFDRTFDGTYLNTKKQSYSAERFKFDPVQPSGVSEIPQDIAYYGNAIFTALNGVKRIVIQSMTDGSVLGNPQNDAIGHADSIMFSDEFYDPSDDYPLLYVSTFTDGKLSAFRITTSALTLIKTYKVDTTVTGYYTDFVVDNVNQLIYTYGYTESSYDSNPNGTNYVIFCCFDMKEIVTDANDNIVPTMLYKKKLPFIMTLQGSTYFNGRMWMISSDYTQHNTNIYVISPDGVITNIIGDFGTDIKDRECEGITFYPDGDRYKMLLLTGDNHLHRVEFAD